jgi:hypothetical protein
MTKQEGKKCKCIKSKTEIPYLHKYSDPLLWDSKLISGASCFHWSSLRCYFWLESTCGKFNWLDMIWKGTHLCQRLHVYGCVYIPTLQYNHCMLQYEHLNRTYPPYRPTLQYNHCMLQYEHLNRTYPPYRPTLQYNHCMLQYEHLHRTYLPYRPTLKYNQHPNNTVVNM